MRGTCVVVFWRSQPLASIQHLFIDGAVLATNGYVAHAIGLLRSGCLVKFCGPTAARMKPPTPGTLNRSLGRMQAWCKLAVEVCRAEFPDYRVLCAFGIFNLNVTPQSGGAGHAVLKLHDSSVERLAQLFQVCPRRLRDQIAKHRPVAAKLAADSACGNREAWQKADDDAKQQAQPRGLRSRCTEAYSSAIPQLARFHVSGGAGLQSA